MIKGVSDARRLGEHEDGAVEGAEGERSRAVGMVGRADGAGGDARGDDEGVWRTPARDDVARCVMEDVDGAGVDAGGTEDGAGGDGDRGGVGRARATQGSGVRVRGVGGPSVNVAVGASAMISPVDAS